jgi:RIO-like serine/threonine protein kinase
VRSLILKKVFHAEAIIYQADVSHNDLSPWNIMILGSKYEDGVATKDVDVEVKVIDFNIAEVHTHPRPFR